MSTEHLPGTHVARRLKKKRRKVLAQSRTVTKQLKRSITSPAHGDPAAAVSQLRATLHSLRHDVLTSGQGGNPKLVAEALQSLDTSLSELETSMHAKDPNAAAIALARGKRALDAAHQKAKAAGHDWPL